MNDQYMGKLKPAGHNRYSSDVRPKAGDEITIKVACSGLEEATGSTMVCNSFPEIQLDTFSKMNVLQLRIHIKDGGETENYYRLVVENERFHHGIRWKEGQVKIDNCEETDSSKNNNGNPLKGTKEGKNEKEIH